MMNCNIADITNVTKCGEWRVKEKREQWTVMMKIWKRWIVNWMSQWKIFRYKPLPWKFCGTSCGDMRMTKGWPKYLGMWAKTNELSESIMINKGRRVYGYRSPGYKQWGSLTVAVDLPRMDMPLSVPSRFTLVAKPPNSYPSKKWKVLAGKSRMSSMEKLTILRMFRSRETAVGWNVKQ